MEAVLEQQENKTVEAASAAGIEESVPMDREAAVHDQRQELVDLLDARAGFYRLLAALYWQPLTQEQIDHMGKADLSPLAQINDACAEGANDMFRYLRKRNSGTRRELAADFTASFGGGHTFKGEYASPYESLFVGDGGLLYSDTYREVFRTFKKERVKLVDGLDYPDDHLSFMCEFLGLESERAAQALQAGDAETAADKLKTSAVFLEDHILNWFDDLVDISNKLVRTRFYRGVLKVTKGYLEGDRDQLDELVDAVSELG